ncbi:MAG: PEP-CTERM-box response regulator transcription factor [Nitrospinota bacterium]
MNKLLIIEDDDGIRTQLKWALSKEFKVTLAGDRSEGLESFKRLKPGVVMLDLGLPPEENSSVEGFKALTEILSISPLTKIIVVTGNDETENAYKAIGLGAYDFYSKPVDIESLRIVLNRAFYLEGLETKYRALQTRFEGSGNFEGMVGLSPEIEEVFKIIEKVSVTDATVLITGESGTGKELVARAIHCRSLRKDKLFVPINCGSIPEALIESELFGYEKGAFTDAKSQKIGLVEKASGGTLFLDEIAELPTHLQVKLLRFIQERKIQRLGDTKEIDVDLRIIAATNVDISKAVQDDKFREDLFYRVSVMTMALPPLRERGEDRVILAKNFLFKFSKELSKDIKGFTPEALNSIETHPWPGNIRELENKVQRAVIMAEGILVSEKDLSLSATAASPGNGSEKVTLKSVRVKAEMKAVQDALQRNKGNISRAADELEVSRPTLHQIINKYALKNFSHQ